MVSKLAYLFLWGKPLVFYFGIITFLSFASTAVLGYFFYIKRPILEFKWHPRMAATSLILGLIHGFLAASIYFGY